MPLFVVECVHGSSARVDVEDARLACISTRGASASCLRASTACSFCKTAFLPSSTPTHVGVRGVTTSRPHPTIVDDSHCAIACAAALLSVGHRRWDCVAAVAAAPQISTMITTALHYGIRSPAVAKILRQHEMKPHLSRFHAASWVRICTVASASLAAVSGACRAQHVLPFPVRPP